MKIAIHTVDPCASKPCKNGGTCSRDGKGGYTCDCTSTGFNGPACNIGNLKFKILIIINWAWTLTLYIINFIDPCASKPCKNNGVCSRDGKGGHTCNCSSTGFNGPTCEIGKNYNIDHLYYAQKLSLR